MSDEKRLICISCPLGCRLTVKGAAEGQIQVLGNKCARGETYGREEALSPRRIVTATVPIEHPDTPRLPVKTSGLLPKELVPDLLAEAYELRMIPPVRSGQVLITDFRSTGVDLVATRSIPAG